MQGKNLGRHMRIYLQIHRGAFSSLKVFTCLPIEINCELGRYTILTESQFDS